MKAKKFTKKLVLNKKTIGDLNEDTMTKVFGGATVDCTWPPYKFGPPSICPTTCYTCFDTGCMC